MRATADSPEPLGDTDPTLTQDEDDDAKDAVTGIDHGLRWWREVIYCVLVYIAYSAVRNQFGSGSGGIGTATPAFGHAQDIMDLQRSMGLFFEQGLQEFYLDLPGRGLIRFWNIYYGLAHFLVTAAALIWMYRKVPERYRLWRNTLAFTTLLALVGFATYTLMPPRLLDDPGIYGACQVYADVDPDELPAETGESPCDEYGFVDTIAAYGGWASFGSDEMEQVSNQFAAMPSMHIGWSTWSALVLIPMLRRRWAIGLAVLYPVATLFCILVTANHYWLDAVGGLVCLGAGYLVALVATRWWTARVGEPEPAGA